MEHLVPSLPEGLTGELRIHALFVATVNLVHLGIVAPQPGLGVSFEFGVYLRVVEIAGHVAHVLGEIVEGGGNSPYLQRKNANDSLGSCAVPPTGSNHHGADLNRNASYQWGGVGTSADPCAQTYKGVAAASAPEETALESLFVQLWPDRHTAPGDPVKFLD